ncbi:hypothetical protein MASR1M107_11160 [Ignavibacteriales bacterium]
MDALFIFMNTILNIRLKTENYVIIEFDNTHPLTVPKLLVYELGLSERRHTYRGDV